MKDFAKQNNVSVEEVENLKEFLSNDNNTQDDNITWKDVFNEINSTIILVTKVDQ